MLPLGAMVNLHDFEVNFHFNRTSQTRGSIPSFSLHVLS